MEKETKQQEKNFNDHVLALLYELEQAKIVITKLVESECYCAVRRKMLNDMRNRPRNIIERTISEYLSRFDSIDLSYKSIVNAIHSEFLLPEEHGAKD